MLHQLTLGEQWPGYGEAAIAITTIDEQQLQLDIRPPHLMCQAKIDGFQILDGAVLVQRDRYQRGTTGILKNVQVPFEVVGDLLQRNEGGRIVEQRRILAFSDSLARTHFPLVAVATV